MKKCIQDYVAACGVCKQAKSEHTGLPGTLQPLPIPDHPWSAISMDFIEGLPKSKQYNSILVIIDKLSKYRQFIPLTHPFTAQSVAQVFMNNIYKLHGLPNIKSQTETRSSLAPFGKNCLSCLRPH
jgi:hypothetical protein